MNSDILKIILPKEKDFSWKEFLNLKLKNLQPSTIEIDCQDWMFNCNNLIELNLFCNRYGHKVIKITSRVPETIVSAKSLFLESELSTSTENIIPEELISEMQSKESNKDIVFHKGTIRSGENVTSQGDLLILGDVNPGAMVSANGDVMIWGKLLGIAHAGKSGNYQAKICALKLSPVQLRIADKVAKGPKDKPLNGLAEKAEISGELIMISPLSP